MIKTVTAKGSFLSSVFGAEDLLRVHPELRTVGMEVQKNGKYWCLRKNGTVLKSCTFSEEEMKHFNIK